ncbi:MAG: SAM-dependent methyltransferase [Thermoplasmata archaeon]
MKMIRKNDDLPMEKFLASVIKKQVFRDYAEGKIKNMMERIDAGYSIKPGEIADPIYTIAKARISVRKKYTRWNQLYLDAFSASYSTPEIIGRYRAERIDRNVIDLGSGAGMQAIMFGLKNKSYGIEINRSRYLMSQLNSLVYSSDVTFMNVDVFDFKEEYDGIIFSDPLRIRNGKTISLNPQPEAMMKKFPYRSCAFDLPPKMDINEVKIKGESEYISVNGYLSRLTLYTGELQHSESSAHIFPADIHFEGIRHDTEFMPGDPEHYIYVPDEALVYAGLLQDYSHMTLLEKDKRRIVLSSNEEIRDFPGTVYNVIDVCSSADLVEKTKSKNARNIFLRYAVDPDAYYRITSEMKNPLGSGSLYIFRSGQRYYVTEMIRDINWKNSSDHES